MWNCSLTSSAEGRPRCPTDRPIGETYDPVQVKGISLLMDTVLILASAAARVLKSADCANSTKSTARKCIKGPQLLKELMTTHRNGSSGYLKLDENGDRFDSFDVFQYIGDDSVGTKVAEFNTKEKSLLKTGTVTWQYHRLTDGMTYPESRCSKPCKLREMRIQQKLKCCWRCKACRPNEILVQNNCQPCPQYQWPDRATNFTACLGITLRKRFLGHPIHLVQMVLSVVGLLVCIAVSVFFVYHKNTYVIKASSRELSFIMLFAIALGYTTTLSFLAIPSRLTCSINFAMFTASFNLIYGPLLVKTVRIYRIFSMSVSSTGGMKLKLIGGVYQVFFSFVLLFFQVSGH